MNSKARSTKTTKKPLSRKPKTNVVSFRDAYVEAHGFEPPPPPDRPGYRLTEEKALLLFIRKIDRHLRAIENLATRTSSNHVRVHAEQFRIVADITKRVVRLRLR